MRILGLSAFHRDSAAALLVDGVPVAAAMEESFTRKRSDSAFPRRAARFCLERAGLRAGDLDHVVFYEKPLRKFERVLATQLASFPRSARTFGRSMFLWLGDRLWMKARIAGELEVDPGRVRFTEHQRCHAAAAFFPSPFDEAAVLTLDDVGEWATTALLHGRDAKLELLGELHVPHSLGLVVSALIQYLGLEPGSDEHLLAALARRGAPRRMEELARILRGHEDGTFSVDGELFRFGFDGERLFGDELIALLGPPRLPGSPLRAGGEDARDLDLAASLQALVEERALALARELHRRAGCDALCLAGELATNRALVARLCADGPFARVFVAPAPGDAGAALGAALAAHHALGGKRVWRQEHAFFGDEPGVGGSAESGASLAEGPVPELAARLARGEAVAWVRSRMDFAASAPRRRSSFASPRSSEAVQRLRRALSVPDFAPLPLIVPLERVPELFEVPPAAHEPLRFGQVDLLARGPARELAQGALGPDGTAWVLGVNAHIDPDLHGLLHLTGDRIGVPLLVCAPFQQRGMPLVCGEADALDAFRRSGLDALVVEDRLYT